MLQMLRDSNLITKIRRAIGITEFCKKGHISQKLRPTTKIKLGIKMFHRYIPNKIWNNAVYVRIFNLTIENCFLLKIWQYYDWRCFKYFKESVSKCLNFKFFQEILSWYIFWLLYLYQGRRKKKKKKIFISIEMFIHAILFENFTKHQSCLRSMQHRKS